MDARKKNYEKRIIFVYHFSDMRNEGRKFCNSESATNRLES